MKNMYNAYSLCYKILNKSCGLKNSMCFHSGTPLLSLSEFFDEKHNWGATDVKSGRSWSKDDLRIKSNTDLHKLWYVLLKEKNMLLTMQQEYNEQVQLFPSPERIDKVEESMMNLEQVVGERNSAYYKLETGETGEKPIENVDGPFNTLLKYRASEHCIPKHVNAQWNNQEVKLHKADLVQFLQKHKEKEYINKRRERIRNFNHVIGLLNRFPKMDMEALKLHYPDVDIDEAKSSRKYKPIPVFD